MSEGSQPTGRRERSLANLRPWKPGQSGNRTGRPVGLEAICREHTQKSVDVLVAALSDDDARIRVTAAGMLLDRGWGKPAQSVTDATTGEKVTFLHLVAARSISDQINGDRVFEAEHTDVDTASGTPPNLLEPALE
jgi:hypothetical protein